ncbi:MAG TPA: DUF1269 domain-containing protein [Gaiellales bacterium]|jgi:uncharacterized membrane protein|nr:DUF1269 domain-containing protein [Gaiellales bacterium]
MADDRPIDLYIAAYSDEGAARSDWDGLKALARSGTISVDALVLVSRDDDGKIHVKDNFHEVAVGATLGALGGAIIGLIFPPSLLASAVVGGAVGAGAGGLLDHHVKSVIKADVEDSLPAGSSGIVALFEERWAPEVDRHVEKAEKVTKHEVDPKSVEAAKANG